MSKRHLFALAGASLMLFVLAGLLFAGSPSFLKSAVSENPVSPAPSVTPAPPVDGPIATQNSAKLAADVADAVDAAGTDAADTGDAGAVTVTVSFSDPADKPVVAARVRALDGTVLRGLDEEGGSALRVRLPAVRLRELAAAPEIVYIETYNPPEMLNDRARDVIAATPVAVPGFVSPTGLRGAGQIVALADSGVDKGSLSDVHPDLTSTPGKMPKIVFISPFSGGDPADPIGHGTHMAATIAGTGRASGGQYRGVAPEASLFVQSILNRHGRLDPPADLVALFRPAYQAGARVHVNGWGGRTNAYRSSASQVDRFVRYYPDFLVVFGAGNNGPGAATLTPEANSKNALVVGASQTPRPAFGPESRNAGRLASFSSQGPTGDGRLKPDLVVPGSAVVSARSSLIAGNFPAHPKYTRMQGTSMSAALAGGAAVLVREYLQQQEAVTFPSAALLKALLINGARPLDGPFPTPDHGFGLLDLTGTLLALREAAFSYRQGEVVTTDDRRTYTFRVTHADAPFKATLAWTDPPIAPGAARALVNDLDLQVIGPDGREYLGNDFRNRGNRDDRNNVEQVIITDPVPGEYRIIVAGAAVVRTVRDRTVRPVQDFAVVFGQPLMREIVAGGDGTGLLLADGTELDLSDLSAQAGPPEQTGRLLSVVNEELRPPSATKVATGADVYLLGSRADPAQVFLVGRRDRMEAVKHLPAHPDKSLLVRINPDRRTGGYHFVPGQMVLFNGRPLDDLANLPAGAGVRASVNPSTQTIWHLEAKYHEERGVLAAIDYDAGRLRLLGNDREYALTSGAALSFDQRVVGGDRGDRPFGAAVVADLRHLLPGTAVRLVLSSPTGPVNYLAAERRVVVGTLREPPGVGRTMIFMDGQHFTALSGTAVTRDGQAADLTALQSGDLVFATVIPGEEQVLGITAYSNIIYGQLIYVGAENVYLADYQGHLHTLRLTGQSRVFRWDLTGDAALLAPGLTVRLTLVPGTREIRRIDVAETERREVVVAAYDPGRAVLRTAGGESYSIAANAVFTKNGFPVLARDLVSGEIISLTVLFGVAGAAGGDPVVVRGSAATRPGVEAPALRINSIIPLSDRYIVAGETSADRLYAWQGEPDFDRLELTPDGAFFWVVPFGTGVGRGQLVAVDGRTGGVAGRSVNLPDRPEAPLIDIADSWARLDIERLLARGLVHGYPDGTFRPDRPVTRAEFTVLLSRLLGLPAARVPELPFTDAAAVPDWARDRIALAHQRGLVNGYADGSFRPHARINRVEAAAILVQGGVALGLALPVPPDSVPYTDWSVVPEWGRDGVAQAYAAGLMRGRPDDRFVPGADLSRAEAAAILNRLLQKLEP
jgi:subtilisin family serine protease